MSGRKNWEVATVLDQREKVLRDIFNSYKDNINSNLKDIEKLNLDIEKIKNEIKTVIIEDNNTKNEFKEEYEYIQKILENIKQDISKFVPIREDFITKLNNLEKRISDNNKKAQNIRNRIKISRDYLNKEYQEADFLKKELDNIKKEYQELKELSNKNKRKLLKIQNQIFAKKEEVKKLINDFDKLKIKATKIKKQKEAKFFKNDILKNFREIDKNKAEKFKKEEFLKISKEINNFINSDDDNIISSYSKLSQKISILKTDIEIAYNKFLSKKRVLETLIDEMNNLNKKEYILLEDFVEDKHIKKTKLEYYDHYKNSNTQKEFEFLISKAKEFLNKNSFKECNELLKKANELYTTISEKADLIKENIEASFELALQIRDTMLDDIDFTEAEIKLIDNNPLNGFKIDCKNGDNIIFEEVKVENGEVIVKLNHIEKIKGSCNIKWKDFIKVFRETIPIINVKKDGISVLSFERKEKKEEHGIKRM